MSELIEELRHHEREYPELVHGPLCGNAADKIEQLSALLQRFVGCYDIVRAGWDYNSLHHTLDAARAITSGVRNSKEEL